MPKKKQNRYSALIAEIFGNHYQPGITEFVFERSELIDCANKLQVELPKNPGDVIYSFRYRNDFPQTIQETAPDGLEWIIVGAGRAKYRFKLVKLNRIVPRDDLIKVKIPDSTPEIINAYALNDEQALLAKVRYNRLVDTFLGVTANSLQNHLRTTVKGMGQIEIDEIYVGLNNHGQHFVIPVQAKGGKDKHGSVQTSQDILLCGQKFPDLACRAVSAQFMDDNLIAMVELVMQDDEVCVVQEKHYRLVPAASITKADLELYARSE